LLIYTESKKNPKLEYVLEFFCQQFLSCDFEVTDEINYFFRSENVIKINYSVESIKNVIAIPNTKYFQRFSIDIIPEFEEDLLLINGRASFDVFAVVFYLLARVEEYGDFEKDTHGRFTSEQSILLKKGLLEKPVVDYWLTALKKALETKYNIEFGFERKFKFKSTVDIDHIYAYAEKPMFVRVGSAVKDLLTLRLGRFRDRFFGLEPYNTFGMIQHLHRKYGLDLHSFILTTDKRGTYDKSFSPTHPSFKERAKELSGFGDIGIHPSYASNSEAEIIYKEKEKLEAVLDIKVTSSRQHFVRLKFPKTYESLLTVGIADDYSMGYPDRSGFRAGTSVSFKWYSLSEDNSTELTIHPFQLMDVTLKNYESLNHDEAIAKAETIITHVRTVNGTVCLIWHNSSFYEREGWAGWKDVYEKILSMGNLKNNNTLDSK